MKNLLFVFLGAVLFTFSCQERAEIEPGIEEIANAVILTDGWGLSGEVVIKEYDNCEDYFTARCKDLSELSCKIFKGRWDCKKGDNAGIVLTDNWKVTAKIENHAEEFFFTVELDFGTSPNPEFPHLEFVTEDDLMYLTLEPVSTDGNRVVYTSAVGEGDLDYLLVGEGDVEYLVGEGDIQYLLGDRNLQRGLVYEDFIISSFTIKDDVL